MAETLGSLVDKLNTVGRKLWLVQDRVHDASRRGEGLDADTVRKLDDLNRQRNALMTEIDQAFARAIESGKVDVDPRHKF